MLRMNVEGVGFDRLRQTVVVLKDWEGKKILPIWIGPNEARSIALELEGAKSPRPLSHDLLLNCIELRGGRVTRVVVNDLQDSTFYATLDIDTPHGLKHVDARPSDAIAVAVRAKCPIFVDGGAMEALVDIADSEDTEATTNLDAVSEDETGEDDANTSEEEDELSRFRRLIGED